MNWMNLNWKLVAPAHNSRRAERIRSWRRRALSRKGARLYSTMQANSQTGSLAMLDEGGMVIAWYERAESAATAHGCVIDTHVSQFYVAEDLALGVPVRDLCSATIHGRSTQTGWRRFPQGDICWATTVIEPMWLGDGRLQGFSHVTHRFSDATGNIHAKKPMSRLRRHNINVHAVSHSRTILAAVALMMAGNFAYAQNAPADSLPQNARKSSYGSGWECLDGYQRTNGSCARVIVPANAYLDASGNSWACERGYRNVNNGCAQVQVPSNAYLDDSYADGWRCGRGYREAKGACAAVQLPANAHAVDSSYGSGWECSRGYRAVSGACTAIVVPANGYLTDRGDDWKCDRGFEKVGAACTAVQVPAHGYLNRQGTGWDCERGFSRGSSSCNAIELPENSHLSYSGDRWRCDGGFSRQAERCVRD